MEEKNLDQRICFKTGTVTKTLDETREIVAIASSQKSDQDNDVIWIDKNEHGTGMDISEFKKNPTILWSHDMYSLPIAKATKISKQDGKLKLKIQFPDQEVSAFSDTVYKLVKGGFINSLSVGFRPDWSTAKFNEKRKGYDFFSGKLFEVSLVNVPANSDATIISRSLDAAVTKGIIDNLERDDFLLNIQSKKEDKIDGQEKTEGQEKQTETPTTEMTLKELHDMITELKNEFSIISKKLEMKENTAVENVHPVDKIIEDLLASSGKPVDAAKSLDDLVDTILKK